MEIPNYTVDFIFQRSSFLSLVSSWCLQLISLLYSSLIFSWYFALAHYSSFLLLSLANSSICLPWLRLVSARKCRALAALQSAVGLYLLPKHLLRAHPPPLLNRPPPPLRTPLLLLSHSSVGSFQRLVCCIIYHVKCARHTAANQTSPRTRELRMV